MKTTRLITHALVPLFVGLALFNNSFGQTANVYNYSVLNQPVNDLVYSESRRTIYASVPSTGGAFGNYIIAIDPFSRQIVGSVFVGSEPNKLAISDDEQFLYVGIDGAASIRKVLLNGLTADITFGIGSGSNGPYFAEDIVVLPNQPNSVAVSRRNSCCSPRHEGVAIYDDGISRSIVTPGNTGSNAIEPGTSANVLYGYNNETTDFGFRRMSIDANGVTITSNLQNAIQGFNVDIRYSKGFIYSSTGTIINPITNSLAGTFAVGGFANGLACDPKINRVFFLLGNTLRGFDSTNFQPTGSVTLTNSGNTAARLVRWGRRGLAYRTGDGRIILFETSLIPAQPNVSDFNGDEIGDYAVFRPQGGTWFTTGGAYGVPFGLSSDIPVAADYDGDNKTDLAVFRDGIWYVLSSSTQSVSIVQFGLSTDKPVPADYDGDQKSDISIYRNGFWWIYRSSDSQVNVIQFGLGSDKPVPSDFNGDGRADFALFRPSDTVWYILSSNTYQFKAVQFGLGSGKPAPADYDADGISDVAIWQNTFGVPVYYVLQSSNNQVREILMDGNTDSVPTPADFDGDRIADPAVFSLAGLWTVQNSRTGTKSSYHFGTSGDLPIAPR